MGKKLKKLDPAWRILLALALVFAFMPALAVMTATPVAADIAGYVSTTVDSPFNPALGDTTITVTATTGQTIEAVIMNLTATAWYRDLGTLTEQDSSGNYQTTWDGKTDAGVVLPEGTYYIWSKTSEQTIWRNSTAVTIDTTPPTMVSAVTGIGASTVIDVTFSEDIDSAEIPDFTVTNPDCTIGNVDIITKVVRLFVTPDLKGHETPTVTLLAGDTVTDMAGNEAVPGSVVATDGIDPVLDEMKITEEDCINAAIAATYTVTGDAGATEPYATVTVTVTDGTTTVTGSTTAGADGSFQVTLDLSALDDDGVTKTIVAVDAADNEATPLTPTVCKDTLDPVVDIVSMNTVSPPPAITGDDTPTFAGTATDANPCCTNLDVDYRVDGGSWIDVTEAPPVVAWSFTTDPLSTGPHSVEVRATDCCLNVGTDSLDFVVDLVVGPPVLLDAVTGWTWDWNNDKPWNTNSRTTIMLVYSEPLDPLTVSTDDFRVDGYPPLAREVHMYTYSPGMSHTFGVVFLTVATMPTYATPLIHQHGPVADYAGYELEPCFELEAQDGIAPLITVTARPEMPGYNDLVTVTATASEQMSEAYIYIWDGTGKPPHDLKPFPIKDGTEVEEWTDLGWKVMEPVLNNGRDWTYSFLYEFGPQDMVMVEVSGHDLSYYTDEWPVEEPLYPCFWKHEKWYQESLYFVVLEKFEIWLCQGWNLISVPGPLADPSLDAVFPSGVTYVYYYNPAVAGGWQYASYDNLSGRWYNPYGMTIDHGKGYFVYCSPPNERVTVWLTWFEQPPAYPLVAGWNMIGYTVMAQETQYDDDFPPMPIHHYLNSLMGKASVLYALDCEVGWIRWHSGSHYEFGHDDMVTGWGYWLFLTEPGDLGP